MIRRWSFFLPIYWLKIETFPFSLPTDLESWHGVRESFSGEAFCVESSNERFSHIFRHCTTQQHPATSPKCYLHQQPPKNYTTEFCLRSVKILCLPLYLFCMFYAFKTTLIMKYAWAGWLCVVLGKIALKFSAGKCAQTRKLYTIYVFFWTEFFYWFWTRSKAIFWYSIIIWQYLFCRMFSCFGVLLSSLTQTLNILFV